jgi:hypothetical protein
MKFGILRDDVEGNFDAEGYPLFEEYVYAETLDLARYRDISTISHITANSKKAEVDNDTVKLSVEAVIQEKQSDENYSYDNSLSDFEKSIISQDETFQVWDYDEARYGTLDFSKDRIYSIVQDKPINFKLEDYADSISGTNVVVRLYTNGDDVLIDGNRVNNINTLFLSGSTPFVITKNGGIFTDGNINYFQFEYSELKNERGDDNAEVRVNIQSIQEEVITETSEGLNDWEPNREYNVGDDVIYDLVLYNCINAHTSTNEFEKVNFEQQGGISQDDVDEFSKILLGE